MNQVDALDEQILAALQAQGRLTMKALAEQVGLSSPAMIERVRRLEDRGVIAGYRAVIQPAALGRPVTAQILATVEGGDYRDFLRRIEDDAAVAECHRITGRFSYFLKVHVQDLAALESLVDALSEAGAECETSVVMSSPVPYRPISPPLGEAPPRSRLSRRRRRAAAPRDAAPPTSAEGETAEDGERERRPGRPRRRAVPPAGS